MYFLDSYSSRLRNILRSYYKALHLSYLYTTYQSSKTDTKIKPSYSNIEHDNLLSVPEATGYLQNYRRLEQQISDVLLVDFSIFPKPSRSGTAIIEIFNSKQVKQYHRLHCLRLCHKWG